MSKVLLGVVVVVTLASGVWAQPAQKAQQEKLPNVTIVSLRFEDVTQISTADQEKIAADLKSRTYHGPDWLKEVDERARYAWQQRGYFGAKSHSNAHQRNDDIRDQEMEVTTSVEEGPKYLLKEIQWVGVSVVPLEKLNAAMPLKRLDVFDADKVRQGFENLHALYMKKGYLYFVVVPETELDDADHTVTLRLSLEPGDPYTVSAVEFSGGNAELRKKVQTAWPLRAGDGYDPTAVIEFFKTHGSILPSYMSADQNIEAQTDASTHSVNLIVHLERR